jgi:hypothetical protein
MTESRATTKLRELQHGVALDTGAALDFDRERYYAGLQDHLSNRKKGQLSYLKWRNPEADLAAASARFDREVTAQMRSMRSAQPVTNFQSPFEQDRMMGLVEGLEQVAAALNLGPISRPVLGSVPLGQANARTYQFSGGEADPHLIVFQDGMLGFTFLLCRMVADVMLSYTSDGRVYIETDREAVPELVMRLPKTYIRFFDLMDAYIVMGHPWRASREHSTGPLVEIASYFLDSTQFFVMAHEFGHIHERREPAATRRESHAQEYAADRFGLRALWARAQKLYPAALKPPLIGVAPAILFHGIDCAEKALAILQGRRNSRSAAEANYPPAMARLHACNKHLATLVDKETLVSASRLIAALELLFFMLWQAAAPRFQAMREHGIKPDRRWTVKVPSN